MSIEFPSFSNVFWLDAAQPLHEYPALDGPLSVDVAIIGGGMAGLHCAWYLRNRGLRVALFEGSRIGTQATGRSTAKITSQHGLCYQTITQKFGADHAALHAHHNQMAVQHIRQIAQSIGPAAAHEVRDAYVYATTDEEVEQLEREAAAARQAGIKAEIVDQVPLPLKALGALRFPAQGQFDPFGYLQGLADLIREKIQIFEESRVTSIDYGEPCVLTINGQEVRAAHVVVTTQQPIISQGHFFAKAFPFAHVVAAAPMPARLDINGMFINISEPRRSLRTTRFEDERYLIVSGAEFRPGEPDELYEAIDDLRRLLKDSFGIREPTHLWTNEDFRPMDGAAFIGAADSNHPRLLIATGFAAWGITQGAVAGDILASCVLGEEHPALPLYDATRHKPIAGGAQFVKANVKAGIHLLGDRILGRKTVDLTAIGPGEGAVVAHGGEKLAVRRDPSGEVVALSAICTHMGCVVDWNAVDRTWDCPCHGSRFDQAGDVLTGPAREPLQPRTVHIEVTDDVSD